MVSGIIFTFLFAIAGMTIVTVFACKHGVFGERCKTQNADNGAHQSTTDGIGIGVGVGTRGHARDGRVSDNQVEAFGAEQGEEIVDGVYEEESRRSGGFSSNDGSEEDEDWRGTV
jgi:hypothetical protein